MRVAHLGWVACIAVLWQCQLGCSSSNGGSSAQSQIRGDYRASSAGTLQEITFYDATHYFLYKACANGEKPAENHDGCLEGGTYRLNDARTELSLTNASTGQTTTLPFESLSVNTSLTSQFIASSRVNTESLVNGGTDGLVNGNDGGLVSGDGTPLTQNTGPLISAFKAGLQNFDSQGSADGGGGTTTQVEIQYEGSCDFLKNCSVPSQGLPAGQVLWGCTGQGVCSDSEAWVSGPDRSYCSKGSVTVCAVSSGQCVSATIRDISSPSGHWEAGNAVLDAIGLRHTVNVAGCSGTGGGTVTITY